MRIFPRPTCDRLLDIGLYLLKFCSVGWVYVLSNLQIKLSDLLFITTPVAKVGYKTDTCGTRVADIVASINEVAGKDTGVGLVWAMPSLAPREVERIVHWIFRRIKANPYPGSSGWTEWFSKRNSIAAFTLLVLGIAMHADGGMIVATAGIAFIFPWPIDLSFTVTAISAAQILLVWGLVKLIGYAAGIIALFIF